MDLTLKGGEALIRRLDEISQQLAAGEVLKAGFLEGATHPAKDGGDPLPSAYIAAIQEFGAIAPVPEHERVLNFNKKGRFAKEKKANYAMKVTIPAHNVVIPSRPFFRTAISENAQKWAKVLGKALVVSDYNVHTALEMTGTRVRDDIQKSIRTFSTPPNAKSTIRKKGFNNPLIDTGQLQRDVDYTVEGAE